MRGLAPSLAFAACVIGASAHAQPALLTAPARSCTAKTAKAVDPGEVASDPAAFAGKCVRLEGWWRDIGFYPTRSEAAVVDALSLALLDNRRIGLYLTKPDQDAAPQAPKLATVIGTVGGACSALPPTVTSADVGYCHYKGGAYLVVRRIELAK